MDEVVLVDMMDRETGREEKITAHEKGMLHRAFSVFLFQGDSLLLQKRASSKYHCGGLWTNTCCSHPRAGEEVKEAAVRRLKEELGICVDDLMEVHSFVYHQEFDNGLTEFEYDHVLTGEYSGTWVENPDEVEEVKWVRLPKLLEEVRKNPAAYTPWFIVALKEAAKGRV